MDLDLTDLWKVTHLSSIPQTFPFRAVSNTFDYTVTLEGGPGDPDTILRGVEERADVGLLSLFEHYQSTTVGEHLKTPAFPVWLVCSESHFSVLWQVLSIPPLTLVSSKKIVCFANP